MITMEHKGRLPFCSMEALAKCCHFVGSWIQSVNATRLAKICAGVLNPKVFLGRWLRRCAIWSNSRCENIETSRPFGKYCRSKPQVLRVETPDRQIPLAGGVLTYARHDDPPLAVDGHRIALVQIAARPSGADFRHEPVRAAKGGVQGP